MTAAFTVLTTNTSLFEYLTTFFANDSFYVVVPNSSSHYRRIMSADTLHRRQCQVRFGMNDAQFSIFNQSRFDTLHKPVYAFWRDVCYKEYAHPANQYWLQHSNDYDDGFDDDDDDDAEKVSKSSSKEWCVECTNLYKELRLLTISLCWNLPRVVDDGTPIVYELPVILQQVYIDSITAKHVSPLLSGCYQTYHDTRLLMRDTRCHQNLEFPSDDSSYWDETQRKTINAKADVAEMTKQWAEYLSAFESSKESEVHSDSIYTFRPLLTGDRSENDGSVNDDTRKFERSEQNSFHYFSSQCRETGDTANAMAAAFDYVICLATSPACGAREFMQGIWIQPALIAAYTQRLTQPTSQVNSPLRVRLDNAPIYQYDWKNGRYLPYIVASKAVEYIYNGGVYGDMTVEDIERLEAWLGGERKLSKHVYNSIIKPKDNKSMSVTHADDHAGHDDSDIVNNDVAANTRALLLRQFHLYLRTQAPRLKALIYEEN